MDRRRTVKVWVVGLALVTLQVPFILTRHIQEDAYITFRCAVNLAATGVYGFNPGERVSASTAHLSVFMLALLRLLSGRAFIHLAQIIYGVGTVLGVYLLTAAVVADRRQRMWVWAIVSVLPVSLNIAYSGMETGLLILMMGAILRSTTTSAFNRWYGIAFVLLPWTRPDAVAIGAIVLATSAGINKSPLRATATYAALLVAGALSWAAFNRLYFGAFLTQTIVGKAAVWAPSGPSEFVRGGVSRLTQLYFGAGSVTGMFAPIQTRYVSWLSFPGFLISLAATAYLVARPSRAGAQKAPLVALALIAYLVPLAYAGGGVIAPWYFWPSQLAAFLLIAVACVGWVMRQTETVKRFALPVGVAILGLLVIGQWLFAVSWSTQERLYRGGIGEEIKNLSASGDTLLLEPAGYVPFYARLWTWDEIGLASPSVTRYRTAYGARWWMQFVEDVSPTFLLERDHMLGYRTLDGYLLSARERKWFTDHYRLVRLFRYDPTRLRRSKLLAYVAGLGSARDYLLYRRIDQPAR